MNHYPRHIGDILTATIGLSLMERGAYTALLDQYYARERILPADKLEVYRLAAAVTDEEKAAVTYVLGRFFTLTLAGWSNARCDKELVLYQERSAKASASAKQGWSERNANAMPTHSERNASHKPVASSHKPLKPKSVERPQKIGLAEPTTAHQELAGSLGVTCSTEFAKYRDWLASSGKVHKNESAGFNNWLRKAAEFKPRPVLAVVPERHGSHVPAKLPPDEPKVPMPPELLARLHATVGKLTA